MLFIHLLPLLLLTGAADWYGLSTWGELMRRPDRVKVFTPGQAALFEITNLLFSLGIVFIGAWLIKALGETFHGRHHFAQSFRVVAYGLSPFFLLRLAEVHPAVNTWIAWGIGITLTIRVFYQGIPKIMEPDPPHAFGLFLMSSILLLFITGLVRFIMDWYLQGRLVRLQPLVDRLAEKLPF